jgi:hypothetical protein
MPALLLDFMNAPTTYTPTTYAPALTQRGGTADAP